MQTSYSPYSRGNQILNVLAEHGPLTAFGIRKILRPEIKSRRLRDSLSRLCKRNLLIKRFYPGCGDLPFYQTNQRLPHRERVASALINPSMAHQPHFRFIDMFESQVTTLWQDKLIQLYPDVKIYRQHQISADPAALELLKLSKNDRYLMPDLLIMAQSQTTGRTISVAVEIDTIGDGEKRLNHKMKHWACDSKLDGIIFIGSDEVLGHRTQLLSENKNLQKVSDLPLVNDFFLLFSCTSFDEKPELILFTKYFKRVNFRDWLRLLDVADIRSEIKS